MTRQAHPSHFIGELQSSLPQGLGERIAVFEEPAGGRDGIVPDRLDQHSPAAGVRDHHQIARLEPDHLAELDRHDDLPLRRRPNDRHVEPCV